VDWIRLAQDRARLRAVVSVMKLICLIVVGIFIAASVYLHDTENMQNMTKS
jgi:hypothetical protein